MTTLALAAFFGLCAIIGLAPHVKYEKSLAEGVEVKAGETIIIYEDGHYTIEGRK